MRNFILPIILGIAVLGASRNVFARAVVGDSLRVMPAPVEEAAPEATAAKKSESKFSIVGEDSVPEAINLSVRAGEEPKECKDGSGDDAVLELEVVVVNQSGVDIVFDINFSIAPTNPPMGTEIPPYNLGILFEDIPLKSGAKISKTIKMSKKNFETLWLPAINSSNKVADYVCPLDLWKDKYKYTHDKVTINDLKCGPPLMISDLVLGHTIYVHKPADFDDELGKKYDYKKTDEKGKTTWTFTKK